MVVNDKQDPQIAVSLICKNAEESIGDCINSFGQHVQFLSVVNDIDTTDETVKVITSVCKKLKLPYKIAQAKWVNDFSAIRNYGLSQIPPEYQWILWLDSDDVVEGADKLSQVLGNTPPHINGVWLPYFYAFDDMGNCNTLFDRERILKTSVGWLWRGRLHETVAPLEPGNYARSDEIQIIHKHMALGGSRSERNFHLLEMMHREQPSDKRVWMYFGFQHFAASEWLKACEWLLKFAQQNDVVPVEKYQCLTYAGRAFREARKYQEAINCDLMAVELYPEWADGYIGLCASYVAIGSWSKAVNWGELARTKEPPSRLIFTNPLDYAYNVNISLSTAYIGLHQFDKAQNCLNLALQVRPNDQNILRQKLATTQARYKKEAVEGAEALYSALAQDGDWEKATKLRGLLPEWLRLTPDSIHLDSMVKTKQSQVKRLPHGNLTEFQLKWIKEHTYKHGEGMLVTDLESVAEPKQRLKEADEHANLVLIAVGQDTPNRIRHYEEPTLEQLLVSEKGRNILTVHKQGAEMVASYKKGMPQNKIARIFCGHGFEPWQPIHIVENGAGGSETWAALAAEGLQNNGYQSFVYASVDGVYDGVCYRNADKYNLEPSNIFISSRIPELYQQDIPARWRLLWFHDVHRGNRFRPEYAEGIDYVVALTKWHAWYLRQMYPFLCGSPVIDVSDNYASFVDDNCPGEPLFAQEELLYPPKLAIIGNGIHTRYFQGRQAKKVPHRFVWSSSPDRGLLELLQHWQRIKKELPDASLHIFYGWEYFDQTLFIPYQAELKQKLVKLLDQPDVVWRGRIGQGDLMREFQKAEFWFYPLHYSDIANTDPGGFRETYCITAVELQAAGCLCVARASGGLGETVADRGVLIPRLAGDKEIDYLFNLVYDRKKQDELREKGRTWAMQQDWSKVAEKILTLCPEN